MTLKFALTTLFVLIFSGILYSQVTQEWVARYNGSNYFTFASRICLDKNNNIIIASTTFTETTKDDYCIIKYSQNGDIIWVRKYNNIQKDSSDKAFHIHLDLFSNIYVSGISKGINSGYDIVTIKLDSSGNFLWVRGFNGPNNGDDFPRGILVDNLNNVYLGGTTCRGIYGGSHGDYLVLKYDSNGNLLWQKIYNGILNRDEDASSLCIDVVGNIYITGRSEINNDDWNDYMTIKYNSDGDSIWANRYDNGDFDHALDIVVDTNQNVYITGYSVSQTTFIDYCTIKYSSNGNQLWVNRYSGTGFFQDWSRHIALDKLNEPIITGESVSAAGGTEITTIKYNTTGQQSWVQRYSFQNANYNDVYSMKIDRLNNIYLTGYSENMQHIRIFSLLKYNSYGNLFFGIQYQSPQNLRDESTDLVIDSMFNIYVTGFSKIDSNSYDIVTIKYSQPIGIQPISSEIPSQFSLSQNYPNPFNPATKIRFSIPPYKGGKGDVSLKIYDILGREVTTLVNEQLQPGTYEVTWDASNYSSGVYYYRITSGNYTETKKMVVMK